VSLYPLKWEGQDECLVILVMEKFFFLNIMTNYKCNIYNKKYEISLVLLVGDILN
jgi:hypothetical protein